MGEDDAIGSSLKLLFPLNKVGELSFNICETFGGIEVFWGVVNIGGELLLPLIFTYLDSGVVFENVKDWESLVVEGILFWKE